MTLPLGHAIGDYEVVSLLGQGGFGITYAVRDPALGLTFALKEYFPEGIALRADDGAVRPQTGQEDAFRAGLARFLVEGRTQAGLSHANIARVVRHFETNGTAYLLMDRVEGRPLDDLLVEGGPFDPAEVAALLDPLLDALDAMQGQGVVHGDIKPSNILIRRDGAPVLLDFGAARVAHAEAGDGAATAGSAGYAAPEQTLGEGPHGAWTDSYGLAATLYRLVTGEMPAPSERRWQSVFAGGADPLPPLEQRLPAQDRDAFSRRFLRAVGRGLELRWSRRPASAADWRKLLGKSVAADQRPPDPRRPGNERRIWLPQALAAIVLASLVLASAWLWLEPRWTDGDRTAQTPSNLPATSLAEDDDAWEQAVRTDSPEGFRAYLAGFPRGRNADAARDQLALFDEQAWQAALTEGTSLAYEQYLQDFADGRYVVEAEARAAITRDAEAKEAAQRQAAAERDDDAFRRAQAEGTEDAFDAYLRAFPGGRNVEAVLTLKAGLARAERDRSAWQAAVARDERTAYEAYLAAFPDGLHLAEALAAVERLTLRPGKVFRDCDDCPEMIVVPPGSFDQGAGPGAPLARSNERPVRPVRLARPFAIGVREVTFDEWDRCVAAGVCRAQPVDNGWGRGRRPVIMVSWVDAQDYVSWLSSETGERYSLPSESQWEYVARAGLTGAWPGGAPERVCDVGNVAGAETGFEWRHDACADPFSLGTGETGYFSPNAMGVYDMVGNVAEWTQDCMNLSYLDAPTDGSSWERGLCSSRVTRGGSWFSGSVELRLSARFPLRSGESNDFTGLRVVREVRE